jgi:hypothetical protein
MLVSASIAFEAPFFKQSSISVCAIFTLYMQFQDMGKFVPPPSTHMDHVVEFTSFFACSHLWWPKEEIAESKWNMEDLLFLENVLQLDGFNPCKLIQSCPAATFLNPQVDMDHQITDFSHLHFVLPTVNFSLYSKSISMKLQRNLHNNECDHYHTAWAVQLALAYTNLVGDKEIIKLRYQNSSTW